MSRVWAPLSTGLRARFARPLLSGDYGALMSCLFPSFRLIVLVVLAGAVLAGCSTSTSYVLDSDIPTPAGFESRLLTGVKRKANLLVGAESIYAGTVIDAESALAEVTKRFDQNGWKTERSSGDQVMATSIFAKGDRRCLVRVIKNQLSPAMSRMSYSVFVEDPSGTVAAGASGG